MSAIECARNRSVFYEGTQELPSGTSPNYIDRKDHFVAALHHCWAEGEATWLDVLLADVYGVASETNPAELRRRLADTAATITFWIEQLANDEQRKPRD
jgi:hypothetical protein